VAYEKKDLSFAIFKNKNMKNDKSPTLTGYVVVNNEEYWLNGFTGTDKNGDKYISGSLKPKEPPVNRRQEVASVDLEEDSIPF